MYKLWSRPDRFPPLFPLLLRVSDGWNVTEKRLDFVAGRDKEPTAANPPPTARIETPELDGLDLRRASVRLDGVVVNPAEILTRGGDGKVAINTPGTALRKLKDGFHSLTVTDATTGAVRQIGFHDVDG